MVGKMKYIASNETLVTHLSNDSRIKDYRVYRFKVFENNYKQLVVEVYLKILDKELQNHIKIRFTDVREYSFCYKDTDYLYHIEELKYLKEKAMFCFSFNLVNVPQPILLNNRNFIFATGIESFSFHRDL
jgi:hypothetical protein